MIILKFIKNIFKSCQLDFLKPFGPEIKQAVNYNPLINNLNFHKQILHEIKQRFDPCPHHHWHTLRDRCHHRQNKKNSENTNNAPSKKQTEELSLDQLSAVINQMLAKLKKTNDQHQNNKALTGSTGSESTVDPSPPSSFYNPEPSLPSTPEPTPQPVPQPTPQPIPQPTPQSTPQSEPPQQVPENNQGDSGNLGSQTISGTSSMAQYESSPSSYDFLGLDLSHLSLPKFQKAGSELPPPQTIPQPEPKPEKQTKKQEPQPQKAPQPKTKPQAKPQPKPEPPKKKPKKDTSKLINDLINGDYFTYFVDLNAEHTGNIFLNQVDPLPVEIPDVQPKKPTQSPSQPSPPKQQPSPSTQEPSPAPQEPNPPPKPKTTPKYEPQQTPSPENDPEPETPLSLIPQISHNPDRNNFYKQPVNDELPAKKPSVGNEEKTEKKSKKFSEAISPIEAPKNLNAIALCYTDKECELDYVHFVSLGLQVKCVGGVCEPVI